MKPMAGLLWAGTAVMTASLPQSNSVALTASIPAQVSSGASRYVDVDFLGLAFEQSSWVRYATDLNNNTNAFTQNLMNGIYSRTGGRPIIRLGGTSPDYGRYLPGQAQAALPVAEQDNYQNIGFTTIGPSYWELAKLFPEAKYMIQVPLATTNISEAVAWAESAVQTIGLGQIHSIQIGNEPEAYSNTFQGAGGVFLGPPDYQGTLTNESWVGNYTKYAQAVQAAVSLPQDFFTAFDIGAQVGDPEAAAWLFDVETCFNLGLNKNNIVKEVSHHYYQNVAGGANDLASGLMTMSVTHTNLDYMSKHIQYLKANHPTIPFIINEIGNSLDATNSYEYQARLGSALWQVDFYLYSLSIGVVRFNWQQIMHSGFDMWLPVASSGFEPQVFANYYSQPFLADFVGISGKTQVAKLEISNATSAPNLAAYTAHDNGQPKRIAIANLDYWNGTSSGTLRPVVNVELEVPSWSAKSVRVTYLTSPDGAGADASTITYAGSQWTYESLGIEQKGVTNSTLIVPVTHGKVVVQVHSSEAVLVYLE